MNVHHLQTNNAFRIEITRRDTLVRAGWEEGPCRFAKVGDWNLPGQLPEVRHPYLDTSVAVFQLLPQKRIRLIGKRARKGGVSWKSPLRTAFSRRGRVEKVELTVQLAPQLREQAPGCPARDPWWPAWIHVQKFAPRRGKLPWILRLDKRSK
jgi:hypothetical protein